MTDNQSPRKLKFPGMLDKQYQKYRERLIQADKIQKEAAKTTAFGRAADKLLPGWRAR